MAKRRNAPALFELLRESNSTKSGQVGNESMRERLGAGSVKNTAPRPPGHPAVKAAKEAEERARREAEEAERRAKEALAAQVAEEKVLEAKSSDDLDLDVNALLSMPEFKAGRPVDSAKTTPAKPEPTSDTKAPNNIAKVAPARDAKSEAQPETQSETKAESKSETKADSRPRPRFKAKFKGKKPIAEPKPEAKPEHQSVSQPEAGVETPPQAKPEANPETKPEAKSESHAPETVKVPPVSSAEPAKKGASKVDVTSEADVTSVDSVSPKPQTGDQAPDEASSVEPKPEVVSSDESEAPRDPSTHPAGENRVVGGQFGMTPVKLGMFGAFALLLIFTIFVIAYSLGKSDAREEIEPQLREQAGNTLAGIEGDSAPARGEDKPIDPLQIARDEDFIKPGIVTPPAAAQTRDEDDASDAQATTQADEPLEITNTDSREPGVNYLHLAPLADEEEARRLQIFLAQHGIQSFIRTGERGGRIIHEPITLVGIESAGFKTSTRKISHEREIQRLGGIWFREHGGSIDYSRPNQWVWYKAPSQ